MSYQPSSPAGSPPASLYSWPPSPTLLVAHIAARLIMILTHLIGIPLLFVSALQGGKASPIVGGTFLIISIILLPLFILWNRKHVKHARRSQQQLGQVDSCENQPRKPRLGMLKFVMFMDGLGSLALVCVFPPIMVEAVSDSWRWWGDGHYYVMFSYGTVSVLIALILHSFLFATEFAQFWSATRVCRPKKMVCPHCNHTMTRLSSDTMTRSESEQTVVEEVMQATLMDADTPRISMNPGQETGTTFKTPRQSENSARAAHIVPPRETSEANEAGEGEQDTLISKSG